MRRNARQITPKGQELDNALDQLLIEMKEKGLKEAPITRANVQKALKLSSRSTLGGERHERILRAQEEQRKAAGQLAPTAIRNSLKEQNEKLKFEIRELEEDRSQYVRHLQIIVRTLQMKNVDVEESLTILRPNRQ